MKEGRKKLNKYKPNTKEFLYSKGNNQTVYVYTMCVYL